MTVRSMEEFEALGVGTRIVVRDSQGIRTWDRGEQGWTREGVSLDTTAFTGLVGEGAVTVRAATETPVAAPGVFVVGQRVWVDIPDDEVGSLRSGQVQSHARHAEGVVRHAANANGDVEVNFEGAQAQFIDPRWMSTSAPAPVTAPADMRAGLVWQNSSGATYVAMGEREGTEGQWWFGRFNTDHSWAYMRNYSLTSIRRCTYVPPDQRPEWLIPHLPLLTALWSRHQQYLERERQRDTARVERRAFREQAESTQAQLDRLTGQLRAYLNDHTPPEGLLSVLREHGIIPQERTEAVKVTATVALEMERTGTGCLCGLVTQEQIDVRLAGERVVATTKACSDPSHQPF